MAAAVTNLIPVRIDAWSSDGAVRVIDTLLLDTTCLPISHAYPHNDGNPSGGLGSLTGPRRDAGNGDVDVLSLSSLVDANAAHLTESILADAEVYGASRSSSKTFMGGRLELLSDAKLYQEVEKQIRTQLTIALSAEKEDLIASGAKAAKAATPDGMVSSDGRAQPTAGASAGPMKDRVIRIKLRIRHENIVVLDEFDYDISTSGIEGCDPLSIATGLVTDLKLPPEMGPSIAASIVEQIYGVDVTGSLDGFTSNSVRQASSAYILDPNREGSNTDFAQIMLTK